MPKPARTAQTELEMVTLESQVPKDHLLRLIDQHIQFDFIRTECESLYCPGNGRPALDPVMLFKMLFVGNLFGVLCNWSEPLWGDPRESPVGRQQELLR